MLPKPILYVPAAVEAGTLTTISNTCLPLAGTSGSPFEASDLKFAPRTPIFVITAVSNAGDSSTISLIVRGESILNTTSIAATFWPAVSTVTPTRTSSPAFTV